jgi:hypothetical protein
MIPADETLQGVTIAALIAPHSPRTVNLRPDKIHTARAGPIQLLAAGTLARRLAQVKALEPRQSCGQGPSITPTHPIELREKSWS